MDRPSSGVDMSLDGRVAFGTRARDEYVRHGPDGLRGRRDASPLTLSTTSPAGRRYARNGGGGHRIALAENGIVLPL